MYTTTKEAIETANDKELKAYLKEYFPDVDPKKDDFNEQIITKTKEFNESVEIIKGLMTQHINRVPSPYGISNAQGELLKATRERGEYPMLSFKEALLSNDASIVFRRVVSDVLLQPLETAYIGQDILAQKITIDGARQVLFPSMGAIVAGDISENGEYPQQIPPFTESALDLKVQKSGLQVAIGDDIIEDSMWDLFGLIVSASRDAMKRWKEQKIFNAAMAAAHTVFDNTLSSASAWTGGTDIHGNLNGSFTLLNLIDLVGGLIANGYTPTDLVLHPLAFIMLSKDPRLLYQWLNMGGVGQSIPKPGIDADAISKYLPWGNINVVVSPQLGFQFETSITLNGSALPAANIGTIMAVDRKKSLVVLQRDEMHMTEFDHPERDIHMMRVGERYAVGALDMGRGMVIAKNVVLTQNHSSVFNVGFGQVV